MALINCSECKKEISNKAKSCPHCGNPIKIKGKGFAIAGLVLGIIGCVYSLPILSGATALSSIPSYSTIGDSTITLQSVNTIAFFALALYISIFAILALIFGLVSHRKGCKLKIKNAAIILGFVSIAIILISMIIVALKGV